MGAVLVGIDRGGCPENPILAGLVPGILTEVEQARSAFQDSLNARLVTTPITTLEVPAQAKAVFDGINADVMQRLGGTPSGGVINWLKGAVDSAGKFLVCDVINSIGGGVDDQFSPASIVLIGTPLVTDDPVTETFGLNPNTPTSTLVLPLENDDHSKQWQIHGTRNFLGLPL